MRYLPNNNLSYPVLIEVGDGAGSGFYFQTSRKVFLVTASHVLYKTDGNDKILRDNNIRTISYDEDLSTTMPIEMLLDLSKLNLRKDDLRDIVLIEIADVVKVTGTIINFRYLDGAKRVSPQPHVTIVVVPKEQLKKFDDVLVSNEAFILGYPNSLGIPTNQQIEPQKPLLRKGIIAGKNTSNKTIILDCPVYFGNSGGIAIEVEENGDGKRRYWIIGVVSQFIPFVEQLKSRQLGYTNLNFENSGYSVVVPIDTILDLTTESVEAK